MRFRKTRIIGGAIALFVVGIVIGVGLGGSKPAPLTVTPPASRAAAVVAAPASTSAAPVPTASPDGTYQGACDYTLGDNPAGDPGTAVATGDIDTTNTGNIGETIKLTLTWPQQGFSPLSVTKTVKLAAGQESDVQFNHPLTSTEVDNLQSWQLGHAGDSGCTYNGTIVSTFGAVSS